MFNPYDYYITPEEYIQAELMGISHEHLNRRIRGFAWDKKRAINTPVKIYKDRSAITIVARDSHIPYKNLMARIYLGWDEVRASTTPVRDKKWKSENGRRISALNRKYPLEYITLAKENGIPYSSFTRRMRAGWDIHRASTLPSDPSNAPMILKEKYGEDYLRRLNDKFFLNKKKGLPSR